MIPLEWAGEGHLNVCSWDVHSDRIEILTWHYIRGVVVQELGLEMTTSRTFTMQRDASLTEQVPHTQRLTKQDNLCASVCVWECVYAGDIMCFRGTGSLKYTLKNVFSMQTRELTRKKKKTGCVAKIFKRMDGVMMPFQMFWLVHWAVNQSQPKCQILDPYKPKSRARTSWKAILM